MSGRTFVRDLESFVYRLTLTKFIDIYAYEKICKEKLGSNTQKRRMRAPDNSFYF